MDAIPASLEAVPPRPDSPADALAGILSRRGLSIKDMRGPARTPWHTKARTVVAREMREMGYSFQQIGKAMGRHYTTVLYYLGRLNRA